MKSDRKPLFDQLDVAFFKHIDDLYDILFTNLAKAVALTHELLDDLYTTLNADYGISRIKRWDVKKHVWVCPEGYPTKSSPMVSWANIAYAAQLVFRKRKTKEGFFVEVVFSYGDELSKGMVYYWNVGHWDSFARQRLCIDEKLLTKIEARFAQRTTDTSVPYRRYSPADDDMCSFLVWLKATDIKNDETVLRHHRVFKTAVLKPVFAHLAKNEFTAQKSR